MAPASHASPPEKRSVKFAKSNPGGVKNKDEDIKLNENPKIGPNEPKGNMVVNAEFECKVVVYTATGSDTQDGNKRIEEKISSKFSQT